MNAIAPHKPGTPASPRDCPLLQSVLATARQMFPGDPWEEVEPHLQRAWKSIAEPVSWEDARPWLQDAWVADDKSVDAESSRP